MKFHRLMTAEPDSSSSKSGKKLLSRIQKRQLHYVKLWQDSGLNQADFCKQQKLNPKTFSNWRKKVDLSSAELALPEENEKGPLPSEKAEHQFNCTLPSGISLSLTGTFGSELILNLISTLATCKFN